MEADAFRPTDPSIRLPARRIVALLVFLGVVFWFARPVIMPFVLAALVAYAFSPYVDAVQARTGRSRLLVVAVGYAIGLAIVGVFVLAFAGPTYREIQLLGQAGPDALTTVLRQAVGSDTITVGDRSITVDELATQLRAAVSGFLQTPEGAIKIADQVLRSVADVVVTLIATFYLLLDGSSFGRTALKFVDPADRVQLERVAARIHVVIGRWLRGQLILVVLVAIVVTIVLGPILHLPYAAALGALTGLLEVITLIGPLIAGTIVAVVALSAGGIPLALAAVAFLFVLRQIEDVVIMPNVLGRAVHIHPLVAMFAVVVGATAFGIVGTFLAVPIAAAISVALHEFYPAELGALPGDPVAEPAGDGSIESVEPAAPPEIPAPAAASAGTRGDGRG